MWFTEWTLAASLNWQNAEHRREDPALYLFPKSTYRAFQAFFFFSCFVGPHPRHMEVPRLGVKTGATAAGLHHSHSNVGSKLRLQPTPQLMATLDPQPTEGGQGLNSNPHGFRPDCFRCATVGTPCSRFFLSHITHNVPTKSI